jgi:hypothetical protein
MWTITCPACAKILRQPEEGSDRSFQCPACGAVFQHPEGSAELTNTAKSGTDHRIQATNPEDDFQPEPEIRAGLPPLTKGQNETQPASKTLDNAFAFGFLGAFVLTIALGALNISPFLFLILGLCGTLIVLMWLMWLMGAFHRKKLHMPEEPDENSVGNSVSYTTATGSEQIRKP